MPWKESCKMSERTKFIAKLVNGETMTSVCGEFGISRVTGHKIWKRFQEEGLRSLNDRSKRPWRLAHQTPPSIERKILEVKSKYPTWGAPKILAKLHRNHDGLPLPARSTVHAILDRHGLVKKRRRQRDRYRAVGTNLQKANKPNDIWCADFKGQFKMRDQNYCYPLTITDQFSRYLIGCEAFAKIRELESIEFFRNIFCEYGLPDRIRTDNGVPFAARSLFGLSKLSVFWLRLGIEIERIRPGHPEENGRHERMHRTLKAEVTKPSGLNLLQQQEMLDAFKTIYNEERPHEALGMKSPCDQYLRSKKEYPKILDEYDYRKSDFTRRISRCGTIKLRGGRKIFISDVFAEQEVGITEADDGIFCVSFMDYELGYYGTENDRFNPAKNPFLGITH